MLAVLSFEEAWPRSSTAGAAPGAFELDLDADTDHTGEIEHSAAEDEREDRDGEEGVIVLPNWDDDDPPGAPGHGVPDCLVENRFARVAFANRKERYDNRINSDADKFEDLQPLTLEKVPSLPRGVKIVLRVSASGAENVRIFDERDRPVIAPREAAAFIREKRGRPHNEHEVKNLKGRAGTYLEYRIEGIAPGARLTVELLATKAGQVVARDAVRVRVAPFLMISSDNPVKQAVTADFRGVPPELQLGVLPGLLLEEDAVRQAISGLAVTTSAPPSDTFWQDGFQAGYAVAPGPGRVRVMNLIARLPREAHNFIDRNPERPAPDAVRRDVSDEHWLWPNRDSSLMSAANGGHAALLGAGTGVFEVSDRPAVSAADHGGNVEVSWPLPELGFPLGRAVLGAEMSPAVRGFFLKQGVQGPPLDLKLDWVLTRHADEVVAFLPERRMAVPSPRLGERLLRDHFAKHPDSATPVFLKGSKIAGGAITAAETVGDHLILYDEKTDLAAAQPGMYIHFYEGKARYQTYDILTTAPGAVSVQRSATGLFSFWRNDPPEDPEPGSRYIIVEKPLHDSSSRVLLITLSELFDRDEVASDGRRRADNGKVQDFWRQNAAVESILQETILPRLQELTPARIVELPVLFHERVAVNLENGSAAFTPNLVNGHLFGNTFLMPKPFVLPGVAGETGRGLFEDAASRALAEAGVTAAYVDNYFLFHNRLGEVHCAANVLLQPPDQGPYWWEIRGKGAHE